MSFIVSLLVNLLSSKAMEDLVAMGVNKLVESKDNGINKNLAKTIINGVAKSKLNPTTEDVFKDALNALK